MNLLNEIFNNREISLFIWFGILMIFTLTQKTLRKSFTDVIKILFGKYFLIIYVTLGVYLLGVFYLLKALNFRTSADIKDSIFWLFSVAFVLVFSLITELILLPILVFIVVLQTFASSNSKYAQVEKLLTSLLIIFGLTLLTYSIYQLANGYTDFFKLGTLHSFILPIILTIIFLPYLYFLSLYSVYESYFVRLDFMTVKKEKVKRVKKYIRRRAHISMNRLNRIMERFDKKVFYDDTNLKEYVKEIGER